MHLYYSFVRVKFIFKKCITHVQLILWISIENIGISISSKLHICFSLTSDVGLVKPWLLLNRLSDKHKQIIKIMILLV